MIGLFKNPLIRLAGAFLLCCTFTTQAAERVTYYHNDALGSPVASSDESGNLVWSEEYGPFGARQLRESTDGNDIWYTGKQEEGNLGVQYFHARWYDPGLGAFLSRDPVPFRPGNLHSFNAYVYANNNPYRYVDPDGQESSSIHHENQYSAHTFKLEARNPDGSIIVRRETQQVLPGGGVSITEDGSVKRLPQTSLDNAPATLGERMEDALLDFSELTGNQINAHSGLRTKEQNKKVGGASNSSHLTGEAADISVSGQSQDKTASQAAHSGLFNRTNNYLDGRVHVDFNQTTNPSGYFEGNWQRKPLPNQ